MLLAAVLKLVIFPAPLNFPRETFAVERSRQLWRSMGRTALRAGGLVTWRLLFADWPQEKFGGRSEEGNSNASGAGSVGVSARELFPFLWWTFTTSILSSRLAAPGSPRMNRVVRPKNCRIS